MVDLAERLKILKKEIDDVRSLNISLKASAKKEEEILRDLVKEIKDMGFDPKTLKQDIENMEKDIESKVSAKEKEVAEVRTALEDIEKKVRINEAN